MNLDERALGLNKNGRNKVRQFQTLRDEATSPQEALVKGKL